MAMCPFGLLVLGGCEPAEQFPLHSLHFILLQLIPDLLLLVRHGIALNVRLDGLLGLLFGVEADIAGRIVDPLNLKMGIGVEVVPNTLVGHVVHPEQVPGIVTDSRVVLCEVGVLSLVEEF